MKKKFTLRPMHLAACVGLLLFNSCVQHKNLINFQEGSAALPQGVPLEIQNFREPRVQPNDILRITVHSQSQEAISPFAVSANEQGAGNAGANNLILLQINGYLVDSVGQINFPVIGYVKVGGLTLQEATISLQEKLRNYVKDAVINMRLINFRFTILGEVASPGTYSTTNQKITILEALGMAGDLTLYANRENILLYREQNGKREFTRLNLKSNDIFTSPYFYIHQNDVIYIEPEKVRIATVQDPVQRYLAFGSATLSVLNLLLILLK